MKKLKIIADEIGDKTRIYYGDVELGGITRIEIEPIESGESVRATLTFDMVQLEIQANMEDVHSTVDHESLGDVLTRAIKKMKSD